MVVIRWPALVLLAAVLSISGCGGGTSTTKGYNHLVAAAEAIDAGDKEKALAELSASLDSSPSAWAYFERARINLEKGQEDAAVADCQKGLEFDPKYRELLWLSAELKKPAAQRFKGKLAKPPGRK
jgi:tetratricopeptide (TPR) repeat protein